MGSVGRNELCPCESGKKFKHCCLVKKQAGERLQAVPQPRVSLMTEVEKIRNMAVERKDVIRELGVFVLYSNQVGDAWLLEITESDGVQLVENGEVMDVSIDENPETIEIDWTHHFAVKDRQLVLTPYKESHREVVLGRNTTQQLSASMRRIRKKCSPEQLSQVHVTA